MFTAFYTACSLLNLLEVLERFALWKKNMVKNNQ